MTSTSESARVEKIATGIFDTIARHFPVAAASDEFYYFPQVQAQLSQWRTWDCFCAEAVADVVEKLEADERELRKLDGLQSQPEAAIAPLFHPNRATFPLEKLLARIAYASPVAARQRSQNILNGLNKMNF